MMLNPPTTQPGDDDGEPSEKELAVSEHVLRRVLGTVLYSLAESQREDRTLAQAVKALNAALLVDYGLGNPELLSIAAGEVLRRMETER